MLGHMVTYGQRGGVLGSVTSETELGKKIQLARKRAGLTQQQLCQKAGLSYSTLAKIERGAIRSPSVFTVANIASATNTPLETLLGSTGQDLSAPAPSNAKKRSKTGVRFVYFDVYNTLVRFNHSAFTEASREVGVTPDNIETVFWRHNDDICSGRISLEQFNKALAEEIGVASFDWHKYFMKNIEPMPGIKELLKWVGENYEMGILSNNMPGFIDELKSRGVIPDVEFKTVVDSCKVGVVKPDQRIYEVAQELAAMEPDEILLVDDIRPFLTAADQAGWQVLWFDEDEPEESIKKVKEHLEF